MNVILYTLTAFRLTDPSRIKEFWTTTDLPKNLQHMRPYAEERIHTYVIVNIRSQVVFKYLENLHAWTG